MQKRGVPYIHYTVLSKESPLSLKMSGGKHDGITTLIDSNLGTDLSVVNAAKVSFGKRSEWEGGSHPDFDKPETPI